MGGARLKPFDPVRLGATPGADRTEFLVWAPKAERVEVNIVSQNRVQAMEKREGGYHYASVAGIRVGDRYLYRLGDKERPDPASRSQSTGVHGPSEIVDPGFPHNEGAWTGLPLADYVIYELHVGTFTAEGTFDAVIPKLDYLKSLGITAVEIMPVAQFPGARNWGYDGVAPYAAQNTYGGPVAFKRLVNACHRAGLAVVLDVVYNHMGPEGNYLNDFGPYFTDRYKTPWGASLNFDDSHNGDVRRFFIESAIYWTMECRVDALRCDAIHAILDFSAQPFLEELCAYVHEHAKRAGRQVFLIAESDLNDSRVIRSKEMAGFGFDSQWSDDFHHAVHTLLTHERDGYYSDFGSIDDLAKAYTAAFVYDGQFSRHRQRRHGNSAAIFDAKRFVVFSQNHDQVGNRMKGDRLCHLVDFPRQKLAAALTLTAPYIPLLFMGEEYAEKAPFLYFISHGDAALIEAVRKGRREEFKAFAAKGEAPDPQSEETFNASRLNFSLADGAPHSQLLDFYRTLLRLRRETPALRNLSREFMEVGHSQTPPALWVRRWFGRSETFAAVNFASQATSVPLPVGRWKKLIDSSDARWGGPGGGVADTLSSEGDGSLSLAPVSFVLISRLKET